MQLTEQNVKEVLLDASMRKTVFLYFYMQGPECQGDTTALESQISENNEYISLVEADVATPIAQAVAGQIGLRGVPALIVFKEGAPVDALMGDDVTGKLKEIIAKYMPSDQQLLLRDALNLEAAGDLPGAVSKAREAYALDEKDLKSKHIYARLLIANKNLDHAKTVLANPGREEAQSQDYQDLMSSLELALKAQESPEIVELQQKFEQNPEDEDTACSLAAALSAAGRKEKALQILFDLLKTDLNRAQVKKTFLDILSTMGGDPLQNQYRRKLYALMY